MPRDEEVRGLGVMIKGVLGFLEGKRNVLKLLMLMAAEVLRAWTCALSVVGDMGCELCLSEAVRREKSSPGDKGNVGDPANWTSGLKGQESENSRSVGNVVQVERVLPAPGPHWPGRPAAGLSPGSVTEQVRRGTPCSAGQPVLTGSW